MKPSRMQSSEVGAAISVIGCLIWLYVGLVVAPLSDWRAGQFKGWNHYLDVTWIVVLPFIVAFLWFVYRVRKTR